MIPAGFKINIALVILLVGINFSSKSQCGSQPTFRMKWNRAYSEAYCQSDIDCGIIGNPQNTEHSVHLYPQVFSNQYFLQGLPSSNGGECILFKSSGTSNGVWKDVNKTFYNGTLPDEWIRLGYGARGAESNNGGCDNDNGDGCIQHEPLTGVIEIRSKPPFQNHRYTLTIDGGSKCGRDGKGNNKYAFDIEYQWTLPKPSVPIIVEGGPTLCEGQPVTFKGSGLYRHPNYQGEYVWSYRFRYGNDEYSTWTKFSDNSKSKTDEFSTILPSFDGLSGNVAIEVRYHYSYNGTTGCESEEDWWYIYEGPVQNISPILTEESCYGLNDGKIEVPASGITGGEGPLGFILRDKTTYAFVGLNNTGTFENIPPTEYELAVQNSQSAGGCVSFFDLEVGRFPKLELTTISSEDLRCHDNASGSINIEAVGGKQNVDYSYDGTNWKTGQFVNTFTDANGLNSTTTAQTFTNLDAGLYKVVARDANGCLSDTLQKTLSEPEPMTLTAATTPLTCYESTDGTLTGLISGGTSGNYTMFVNQGTPKATPVQFTLENLPAGPVVFRILDARFCRLEDTVDIYQPEKLYFNPTSQNLTASDCYGEPNGSLAFRATGGEQPYTYSFQGTPTTETSIEDLTAGAYSIQVSDDFGCVKDTTLAITEPEKLVVQTTIIDASCEGYSDGSITIDAVSGGTGVQSFEWFDNSTDTQLENLSSGNYPITITDEAECSVSDTLVVGEAVALVTNDIEIDSATCDDVADGNIRYFPEGGTSPYDYRWNDGLFTPSQELANVAGPKKHVVEVMDANGCTLLDTIFLPAKKHFQLDIPSEVAICPETKSIIPVAPLGLDYQWLINGAEVSTNDTGSFENAGVYTLIATDPNGCQDTTTVSLSVTELAFVAEFLMPSFVPYDEQIVVISLSNPEPDSLNWNFGEEAILHPEVKGHSVVSYPPGIDTVTVWYEAFHNGCERRIGKLLSFYDPGVSPDPFGNVLGADDNLLELGLYPNPNAGQFNLSVILEEEAAVEVLLYTSFGELIDQQNWSGDKEYDKSFDLMTFQPGLHFVKVISADEVKVLGFIVE